VLTTERFFCDEDTDFTEAAALMRENGLHALPVLDADHALVGLLRLDSIGNAVSATEGNGSGVE
jgi:CBS domain-containing protein